MPESELCLKPNLDYRATKFIPVNARITEYEAIAASSSNMSYAIHGIN